MSELLTPMEDAEIERPGAESRTFFPIDAQIRERGYTIARRPVNGQPIWRRNGIEFSQEDVIRREGISVNKRAGEIVETYMEARRQ